MTVDERHWMEAIGCDRQAAPSQIGRVPADPNLSVTVYANGQLDVFGDPVSVVLALHELGLCPDGGDGA